MKHATSLPPPVTTSNTAENTPSLAVIVYNHNGQATLDACLASVLPVAAHCHAQVLVVDNASTDSSRALLAAHPGLEVLSLAKPASLASALNVALSRFSDFDVVVMPSTTLPECALTQPQDSNWLEMLVNLTREHEHAGLLGTRVVSADGRILSEGHQLLTGLGLHYEGYRRHFLQADAPVLSPSTASCTEADSTDGDLLYITSAALTALQAESSERTPFDPAFGPGGLMYDDLAFSLRVAGFRVLVTSAVKAVRLGAVPPPEGADVPALARLMERDRTFRQIQAEYWKYKWGWDPLLPDMGELRRLYGHTRVCWNTGDVLRWNNAEHFPTVDLCMVTWNSAANLERCLQSLAATNYPADRLTLYLVDNASTDATPQLIERLTPHMPFAMRVTRLAVNTGGVVGMNWAMAEGRGDLVAKLDDDIILPAHWLKNLVDVFRKRPFAGIVGPRIVDDTPAGRVQCADYAYYPVTVTHEQETDEGHLDALARVTHVRGCCNLYRRDVIRRCGPLDIRFSPSQWDDPDHQLALLFAGYEVIYDGSVSVAHKMTTGSIASGLSLANASINKAKMLVKWGQNAPEIFECALLLSAEGRYVPDQSTLAESAPTGATADLPFPRLPTAALLDHMREAYASCSPVSEESQALTNSLLGMARQLFGQALESRRQGQETLVIPQLRTALCCTPHDAPLLRAFADVLDDNGATGQAACLRCRAEALSVNAPPRTRTFPLPLAHTCALRPYPHRASADTNLPQVLFCLPHSHRLDSALRTRLDDTAHGLCAQGFHVTVDCAPCPRVTTERIVHFWTLDQAHESLSQLKAVGHSHPEAARILTPLWNDPEGARWGRAAEKAFKRYGSAASLPSWDCSPLLPGDQYLFRRQAIQLAHRVLVRAPQEAALLGLADHDWQVLASAPLRLPAHANPDLFRKATGLTNFVLAVAPLHPLTSQALLLLALRETGLPVVLIGEALDPWYLHLCRQIMPSCLFVKEAEADLVASAFAAATVHALPALDSRGEQNALYAHAVGTPTVVARNSPESWQLGADAFVCDPASVPSVAKAVAAAWNAPRPTPHTCGNADHITRNLSVLYTTINIKRCS